MMDVPVAMLVPETEAEGPGQRMAIWVQGCPMRCPGCCNPEMLEFKKSSGVSAYSVDELLSRLGALEVEGVSLLGGEPFAHAEALAPLAEGAQTLGRSVMVFSGYTLGALRAMRSRWVDRLLGATDLLVDGPYERARHSASRRWIGSDNQVMHFLSERYRPDDPRFGGANHVELRLRGGELVVNGWPVLGAARLVARSSRRS